MIWFIAVGFAVVWYSGFYCGCLGWRWPGVVWVCFVLD